MTFHEIQSDYKARLDADAWFTSNGVITVLSKSAEPGDVNVINEAVETDLRDKGLSFIVKMPNLRGAAKSGSGRALFYGVVEVVILENPLKNRVDSGIGVTGSEAALEVFQVLLGDIEIQLADNSYQEKDGPSGTIAYICRTEAETLISPR